MWRAACGLLLVLLAAGEAEACRSNADCRDGTVCLFTRNRSDGACFSPQPQIALPNDAADIAVPLRERAGTGAACQFTPDCLPGYRCYKRVGQYHGVCLQPQ